MHNPPLILIADDEAEVAQVLKQICRRAGFESVIADDGVQAVDTARHYLPDLMLLDIQMPKLDGWGVLKTLREEEATRQIPIIVITAAATKPEDAAHGIDLGADDYIAKPFHYHELLARIRAKIRAKKLEESLQQRTQELELLVRLGVDLNRPLELEPLAEHLLRFLTEQVNADVGMIYLYGEKRTALSLQLYKGSKMQVYTNAAALPDTEENTLMNKEEASRAFANATILGGIMTPLHHHDEYLGALAIGYKNEDSVGEDELRVMNSVSTQAALAIRNVQLYEQLRGYADELESRVEQRTAELRSAQEQLVRSEKLASLGRLSGEIAHEINNPLQPIMTCLEDALEDIDSKRPVQAEGLEIAMSEVQRLKRIVSRLLDYARPDKSDISKVDVHRLITQTLPLAQRHLDRLNIRLATDLQAVPAVHANPDQIKQVFLNLVLNAIEAMESKGDLLEVRLWQEGQFVHFTVRDEGEGIAPQNLSLIFEPFYSSKTNGSGIGLAVSHSIIEALGGKINVQSQVEFGTEFKVSLPVAT